MKKSKDKTKNLWAQTSAHIKSMFIYVQKKKKKKKIHKPILDNFIFLSVRKKLF